MRNKQAFLLLEVLVALTLVTLCLMPFIGVPAYVIRDEWLSLERLELQHISDNTFFLIKEQIYSRLIPWEQLASPKKKKTLLFQDEVSLPIKEMAKQCFIRKCYIYSSVKKGENDSEYRLVTVEVFLHKKSDKKKGAMRFSYEIFMRIA